MGFAECYIAPAALRNLPSNLTTDALTLSGWEYLRLHTIWEIAQTYGHILGTPQCPDIINDTATGGGQSSANAHVTFGIGVDPDSVTVDAILSIIAGGVMVLWDEEKRDEAKVVPYEFLVIPDVT